VVAYFRVVVPDPPVESPQLAVERIAEELARLLTGGHDEQRQEWIECLSGSDKDADRPVLPSD
jgi:hypothetical protein